MRVEGNRKGEVSMGLISVFLKLIDVTCMSEHTYSTERERRLV